MMKIQPVFGSKSGLQWWAYLGRGLQESYSNPKFNITMVNKIVSELLGEALYLEFVVRPRELQF